MSLSSEIPEDHRKRDIDAHQAGKGYKNISEEFIAELKQFWKKEWAKIICCVGLISSYQKLKH